jgi:hypothetical protein
MYCSYIKNRLIENIINKGLNRTNYPEKNISLGKGAPCNKTSSGRNISRLKTNLSTTVLYKKIGLREKRFIDSYNILVGTLEM